MVLEVLRKVVWADAYGRKRQLHIIGYPVTHKDGDIWRVVEMTDGYVLKMHKNLSRAAADRHFERLLDANAKEIAAHVLST